MSLLAALLGAVCGLGAWIVLMALDGRPILPGVDRHRHLEAGGTSQNQPLARRLGIAGLAGMVMGTLSWPVIGVVLAIGVVLFWDKLGSAKQARRSADEADAFAGWSEQVYSAIRAGNGTNTAIKAAADHAHPLIKTPAAQLADRLDHQPLSAAVGAFAHDLANPTADPVCAAIILSHDYGSSRLSEMMKLHAEQARRSAQTRLEISASRGQIRTSVRATVAIVISTMILVRFMAGELFGFYDTVAGTLVLIIVGLVFLAAFAMLANLVQTRQPLRYFTGQIESPSS